MPRRLARRGVDGLARHHRRVPYLSIHEEDQRCFTFAPELSPGETVYLSSSALNSGGATRRSSSQLMRPVTAALWIRSPTRRRASAKRRRRRRVAGRRSVARRLLFLLNDQTEAEAKVATSRIVARSRPRVRDRVRQVDAAADEVHAGAPGLRHRLGERPLPADAEAREEGRRGGDRPAVSSGAPPALGREASAGALRGARAELLARGPDEPLLAALDLRRRLLRPRRLGGPRAALSAIGGRPEGVGGDPVERAPRPRDLATAGDGDAVDGRVGPRARRAAWRALRDRQLEDGAGGRLRDAADFRSTSPQRIEGGASLSESSRRSWRGVGCCFTATTRRWSRS